MRASLSRAGVTEDANVPGDLKRNLTQLRDLDTQSQELFERMQKLSKNHILRAKKAVQEGREPDEEYLVKARRAYKELVEIDEEKVDLADRMDQWADPWVKRWVLPLVAARKPWGHTTDSRWIR